MPEQIYIGNFAKGLKLDKTAFNIDNDAFPFLFNYYSWRGRIKRKRGTALLGQLQRQVVLVNPPTNPWEDAGLVLTGGEGNLLISIGVNPSLNAITNIVSGSTTTITIINHTFTTGQEVQIIDVGGMTQINNLYAEILSVVPLTSITVNINSSTFSAYTAGGNAYLAGNATITPGSISLSIGGNTYTEPTPPDGTLVGTPVGSGTINYSTGTITIVGGGGGTVIGTFSYYPGLPVMGLRDFSSSINLASSLYPILIAFDTIYSYQIFQSATGNNFYGVNYYKGSNVPFVWSGGDYQQFWTTNYPNTTSQFSGSLWATNNKPGFNFKLLTNTLVGAISVDRVSATRVTVGLTAHGLVVGDFLWFNEVTGTIGTGSGSMANQNINGQTGKVFAVVDANTLTVDFTGAAGTTTADFQVGATGSGGLAQYLTNTIVGQDGIKWYDGDPTSGTGLPTGTGLGWVNFAPPLTAIGVSINNTPTSLYYLVGALAIVPFKDRLLFFSPYIQASTGSPIQLQDTVLWSWNGTPYYTALVPLNQSFNIRAYYVDQTGLGGYLPAGISQPIITVSNNQDVLLIGFGGDGRKTRFAYTGNDLQPFLFFNINSELPSSATFSAVALDKGAIDIGQYGIAMTDQQSSQRIDLDIPDEVFQIKAIDFGALRVNAIRDFKNEWIYFTYPHDDIEWKFPTQTFLFNYRDNTWSVLYENFTTHGRFREQFKRRWTTLPFKSWNTWREPWNSGATSTLFTDIIAGNPQGYVLLLDQGTSESVSGTITAVTDDGGFARITSTNHCVLAYNPNTNEGDFLLITGFPDLSSSITFINILSVSVILSTVNDFEVGQYVTVSGVVGTTELNGNTYQIIARGPLSIQLDTGSTAGFTPYVSGGVVTGVYAALIGKVTKIIDANNFTLDILFTEFPNPYIGLAKYTRLAQPLLQTKQFPVYWNEGRQVRLSVQKYLMESTSRGQVTVDIYLNQDSDNAWNNESTAGTTNGLIYSQIMYTCPESTNLGLTPANVNLQMPTGISQAQIWHRFNTSLIGDTFQIGITLNEDQMKDLPTAQSEIILHGIHLTVERGPQLA